MEYNESYFKKSANKKAIAIWLLIAIILTVAYILEWQKGLRTLNYTIVFLAICWVPIITSFIIIKLKGALIQIRKII